MRNHDDGGSVRRKGRFILLDEAGGCAFRSSHIIMPDDALHMRGWRLKYGGKIWQKGRIRQG